MANPMMQNLLTNRMAPIKNLMALVKTAGNPMATFQQMAMRNPNVKQVMDYVNSNGGNPEQAFYKLAKEKGIDPNEILNLLK